MSTCQSRLVSPSAAKAKATEPSPLSSQPIVRGIPAATAAAAADEVMPVAPLHEPSPRPSSNSVRRFPVLRSLATLAPPLPASKSPSVMLSEESVSWAAVGFRANVDPARMVRAPTASRTGSTVTVAPPEIDRAARFIAVPPAGLAVIVAADPDTLIAPPTVSVPETRSITPSYTSMIGAVAPACTRKVPSITVTPVDSAGPPVPPTTSGPRAAYSDRLPVARFAPTTDTLAQESEPSLASTAPS